MIYVGSDDDGIYAIHGTAGLASGDTRGDWEISAGEKAYCLGGCLGIGGLLIGGTSALLMNRDMKFVIKGRASNFARIQPKLRSYAILDTVIPPEISRLQFQNQ